MRQTLLAAAAAVMLATAPAAAGDLAVTYDPSIEPSDWTGFYAGAWLGGRLSTITATACGGGGVIGVNCATGFGLNGVTGGFTAGYDYQLDTDVVLGGFVTIPVIRPTTTATTPMFAAFGMEWAVEPQFALAAGGRIGLAQDRFMPYALAGLGMATVTVRPNFPVPASTATHFGAVLGGGVEAMVTDKISVDARYMLGLMGAAQYDFGCGVACQSSYTEVSHNFSIGLNYRF